MKRRGVEHLHDGIAVVAHGSPAEKDRAGSILWRFVNEFIFDHGIFNADSNPGNYLFANGNIIFLDFDCVKKISESIWQEFMINSSNRFHMNIPKGFVFANRLKWGMHALLARFETTADFRTPLLNLLYANDEAKPPPFTAGEMSLLRIQMLFTATKRSSFVKYYCQQYLT